LGGGQAWLAWGVANKVRNAVSMALTRWSVVRIRRAYMNLSRVNPRFRSVIAGNVVAERQTLVFSWA
jgi:hypothetical protein